MGNVLKESPCCKSIRRANSEIVDNMSITSGTARTMITQIQALFRGFIFRKKANYFINLKKSSSNSKSLFDMGRIPGKELEVDFEPEENEKVKELNKRITAFECNEKELYLLRVSNLRKFAIQYADGSVYSGYMNKDWQREGYGKLYLPDGSKYEGFFRKNTMEGRGRLINSEGFLYDGEFLKNKANGFGKYISLDGIVYTGQWLDEKQHGYGEEIFADGSRYEGEYFMGKKNGRGKFKWPDGYLYEGEFFNNDLHGYGTYRWKDGRIYQGHWLHNKMNGTGIFIWPDKKKYIGTYNNDNKHGYGIFYWPDGRKYEGCWSDGKQHGFGLFHHPSEGKRYGEWQAGKRVRVFSDENEQEIKSVVEEINKKMAEYNIKDIQKFIFNTEKSVKNNMAEKTG